MDTITAPYGFVPLSDKVVQPEWLTLLDGKTAPPLHDVPFQDGLCGTLELEITAETPIFVRGTQADNLPFRLGDNGPYAIPGTALRGALRNIVEIIGFGRFDRVDNHRYAVRDMQNRSLYLDHMAAIVPSQKTGKGEPMPLVNAGWLGKEGDSYSIEVCDFGRVEYRQLMELAERSGVRGYQPGNKQSSVEKYRRWGQASRQVKVAFEERRPGAVNGRTMFSNYGVATLQKEGRAGTLVFTGQPSRWIPDETGKRPGAGNAKHHDFVFMNREKAEIFPVSSESFQDFEFAHSDRGQQNNLGRSLTPNEEWGYWEKVLQSGNRVPVFFLTEEGPEKQPQLRAMGLAMMFRLSYKYSIGEGIDLCSPDHRSERTGLDLAEGLFGAVRGTGLGERGAVALKGRVGISHAAVVEPCQPATEISVVLGSPKASYYPNYVEQDPARPGSQPPRDRSGKPLYRTWMDKPARPRGWKRYRPLTSTWLPQPPSGGDGRPLDLSKVGTQFRPLPAGTSFRAHVDVHNLKPEELGALMWAITFGGNDHARHTLGMARPLGYGRCRLRVSSHDVRNMRGEPVDPQSFLAAFETFMDGEVSGWKKSAQIREFLTLAVPVDPERARYQRLDPGRRINEFVEAKRAGLALPSATIERQEHRSQQPPRSEAPPPQAPKEPEGPKVGESLRATVESETAVKLADGASVKLDGKPYGMSLEAGTLVQVRIASVNAGKVMKVTFHSVVKGQPVEEPGTDTVSGWAGKQRGEALEVDLTSPNKSGKWRGKLVENPALTCLIEGKPQAGAAAAGKRVTVYVLKGDDPANLVCRW